jgi:hypothetical protein
MEQCMEQCMGLTVNALLEIITCNSIMESSVENYMEQCGWSSVHMERDVLNYHIEQCAWNE